MRFSTDTGPAPNLGHDALDVLVKERQALEELTSLAAQVRQALIGCDAAALNALAGRPETLARHLVMLDGSRQALMKKWFVQDECRPVAGEVQDDDEGARLLAACEGLREQAGALRTANAVNRQLLAGIARWMNGLLSGFIDLLEPEGAAPYDRHGVRPVQLESNLLMDRQV